MTRVVAARAAAIVVLAVALGVILLEVGTRAPTGFKPTVTVPTVSVPTTTTVPTGGARSTTTTTALNRASVKVLVANGSSVNGAATSYTTLLAHQGWGTLTAVTADAKVASSVVYYASGQQAAAAALSAELGLPSSAVQALSPAVPVAGTAGAAVVVLIGADIAAKVPSTTTTRPSTTTTRPSTTTTTKAA